jgi:hypothetical protein
MTTVQILVISFSCILFFGRLFFGFFKRLSPFHKYSGSSCQINSSQFENSINNDNPSNHPNNNNNDLNNSEYHPDYNELDNESPTTHIEQPGSSNISNHMRKKKHRHFLNHKNKYDFQSVYKSFYFN